MSYPPRIKLRAPWLDAEPEPEPEPPEPETALPTEVEQAEEAEDPEPEAAPEPEEDRPSLKLAYVGVLFFFAVYFFRPEEFFHALVVVPFAKITGALAGAALLAALLSGKVQLKTETKLLLALFGYLCLGIPFSTWQGGSFQTVVFGFGKTAVMAMATALAVTNATQLRRLMMLQTVAMLVLCLASLVQMARPDMQIGVPGMQAGTPDNTAASVQADGTKDAGERMYGVGSLFRDPNDFALNLCIVLPFGVSLFLTSRRLLAKAWWGAALSLILVSIVRTYSRGAFLVLLVLVFLLWRRFWAGRWLAAVLILPLAVGALAVSVAMVGHSYLDRMSTIAAPHGEASSQDRLDLLRRSVELTVKHPVFGVGPGQFQEQSRAWLETHNTYTQFSAEAGVPALALFLALLWLAVSHLHTACKTISDPRTLYLVQGLFCSLVGYAVGAFFLSTAYLIYPYLLVACAVAAANLAKGPSLPWVEAPALSLPGLPTVESELGEGESDEAP